MSIIVFLLKYGYVSRERQSPSRVGSSVVGVYSVLFCVFFCVKTTITARRRKTLGNKLEKGSRGITASS